ncbi:hypothetical protein GF108_08945 [Phyllobacterium sp. SYP-B3895]|uniref:hypothetical protein n=1 Tax=Phyllobacterium sp. SYP-B3895 TaxID=2663240 RepID=UPI001299B5B8|nr:hypothetical protein [Phyllobacterium sp. SYP-B3895]MRG55708.1 hypothetical protein [Phyllobacterium sp. SYP-B3895]
MPIVRLADKPMSRRVVLAGAATAAAGAAVASTDDPRRRLRYHLDGLRQALAEIEPDGDQSFLDALERACRP